MFNSKESIQKISILINPRASTKVIFLQYILVIQCTQNTNLYVCAVQPFRLVPWNINRGILISMLCIARVHPTLPDDPKVAAEAGCC